MALYHTPITKVPERGSAILAVPYLTEVAFKARRALLSFACLGIVVGWFHLRPSRIEGLDLDIPQDFPLFALLWLVTFYHFSRFLLFAMRDMRVYLRERIKGLQSTKKEKFTDIDTAGLFRLVRARLSLPRSKLQEIGIWVELSLEIALPLLLGLAAMFVLWRSRASGG